MNDYIYMFKLRLKDDLDHMLEVLVYKEDGDKFFGIPAVDLVENNISLQTLGRKMEQLSKPDVWMSCCIKSYIVHKGTQSEIRYRLFDTTIVS